MPDYGTARARAPFVQNVGTLSTLVKTTPVLDTSAYASGDVLVETTEIANAVSEAGGTAELQSLVVVDQDDTASGFAMDVWILASNVAMGTKNSAPSISDANALEILGFVSIAAADFKDLGGVKVASINNIGIICKAAAGSTSLFFAVVNGTSTPTLTAAGVKFNFGFRQD